MVTVIYTEKLEKGTIIQINGVVFEGIRTTQKPTPTSQPEIKNRLLMVAN